MPEYRYQAIDKRGRSLNGNMLAHDETDLQKKLKDLGLWLTESVLRHATGAGAAEIDSKVNKM
jgi:type II secretory pathway component PulF